MTHTFDPNEGEDRKAEAIDRVELNAPTAWMTAAIDVARSLADVWSTDDVWRELDRLGVEPPHEPRAMGAVIRVLVLNGEIVATGEYIKSARAECHRRPIALWRTIPRVEAIAA